VTLIQEIEALEAEAIKRAERGLVELEASYRAYQKATLELIIAEDKLVNWTRIEKERS
jgi:SAM-dependent MidA family methyltransferase